ncbi:MAG: response regulator transcription factor [Betaproteobacteria bacterium]|nr:response regulator transcription factor [Betaproteobacteria bacterium]
MNTRIRVLLMDDHTLFREGLAELLERSGKVNVVGMTGNPDHALQLALDTQPDVMVMDLHMPGTGGIDMLQRFRQQQISLPTVILTVSDHQNDMANALRAGARGYLLKDMEPADVVQAIQRAAGGETVIAPAMTTKLVNLLDAKQDKKNQLLGQLTQREQQILGCLARGDSNKIIALSLGISHDTVKLHVHNIFAKLNITSRVEAAVFAVEQGLNLNSGNLPHRN